MRDTILFQSGRSMVEMLGVLAIVGVLSVGGIAGYSTAMNTYKLNQAQTQISAITSKLATYAERNGSYAGLNNKVATKINAVPPDMVVSEEDDDEVTLLNPFGGKVNISSYGEGSGMYQIMYYGLTQKQCIHLISIDWSTSGGASTLNSLGVMTTKLSHGGGKPNLGNELRPPSVMLVFGQNFYSRSDDKSYDVTPVKAAEHCKCSEKNNCVLNFVYF